MADTANLWEPEKIKKAQLSNIAQRTRKEYAWLESEIENLYIEFDKLTKKSPANRITDLALQNVNSAIKDAKELLNGDRSVDRIAEFVAAGENPVNSDVLLVLAKLKAALDRFRKSWSRTWNEEGLRGY